jgi:serine/threonine-protein kinase
MIGAVLAGRFELTGLLAETSILSLYSARDRLNGKDVSLRMVRQPFDREGTFKGALARAVEKNAVVQSPNVERLYELVDDPDEGGAYIVGDLTRAPSLADRIRKLAPFTSPVAVAAAIGIARGLDAFHKSDLVHGDVSADNVAMMADGDTRLQMGAIWEAYAASQTAGAVVLPSIAPYLAPEVSAGGMPSKKSDVYSLGILLYELLAGRKPYTADTAIATAMRHSSEPTPRVRSISPSAPVVLDEIVYKAMAKDPEYRYANAGELFSDLRQVQDAMRFGRTLSWPLKVGAPVPAAGRQNVAPKMSAIRDASPRRERREVRDADIPGWMWGIGAVGLGAILCMLGLYVVTNIERPRLVSVPNLKGLTIHEGRQTLGRMGLSLKVGKAVPNEMYDPDKIVDSSPENGEMISEKSSVTVTISAGSREVEVPQLKGLTPDKAKSVLATENLTLDDNIDHAFDPSVPVDTICRQDPPAGTQITRDKPIHVAVNSQNASAPPDASNPQEVQSYVYSPSIYLNDITQPVEVRIDVTDDQGTRTFFDEVKQPGDHIDTSVTAHGSQATFRIFYDGRLVKTITKNALESAP